MKYSRIIILTFLVLVTSIVHGQKDTLFLGQIYQDPTNLIVSQKILVFDSLSRDELIKRFENWGGQFFRNYSEVQTSKTESQITLLYTTSSFLMKMYIIVLVEFKDGKIKLTFRDDGNLYVPGRYSGSLYINPIQARSKFVKSYFDDGMIIYKPSIHYNPLNYQFYKAENVIAYRTNIDSTSNIINDFIKKASIESKNTDW